MVHMVMRPTAVSVTRKDGVCVGFMEPQKHIRTSVIEVGNIAELNKWILNRLFVYEVRRMTFGI